ncbi:hypothetical protein BRC81_11555 [Halobacteriales archaeon QS_1_68_20]|nr:MAG: hypothetical protein BRC81_11555 [Halobacteriales archaeon QS_1_68_20]
MGETDPGQKRHTLATGETVTVALQTNATMTGTVFSAALSSVRDLLPDELSPLRFAPNRAAITFVSVA